MKCRKVLIADDEMIIREGIRESVDWASLDLEVIGEAEDGEEALELAMEHEVDILLVDLNMPIMNGLTLIKWIREKLPKCRVIIITGHDEFTYAQQAIRLQVDDYITKPIEPDQLIETLLKVCTDLQQEEEELMKRNLSSKQVEKNVDLLREQFCLDWIKGKYDEDDIVEQLEFLELPVRKPNMIGVIRWPEMDTKHSALSEADRKLILFGMKNITSEWFEQCPFVICRDEDGLMIVILWSTIPEKAICGLKKSFRNYLKITVHQHFEAVDVNGTESCTSLARVYALCKEHVYKMTEISELVQRAEQYMYENYQDSDLNLEVLAEALHVSPVYLSRLMKKDLGTTFVSILTNIRISQAIQLLNSTDYTINEISELVGYDTQHYFSTSFKKVVGVPPKQYRNGKAYSKKIKG